MFHWSVEARVRRRDGKDKIPYKPKYLFVELYRIALWTLNLGISKLYFIIRRSRQRNVFLLLFVIHFNFFSDQKTKAKYFYLMQDPSSDSLPESQTARNFDLLLFFVHLQSQGVLWSVEIFAKVQNLRRTDFLSYDCMKVRQK